jgi:hypothetical protein
MDGGRIFTEVGNNGTFYYPKLDLLATAVFLDDVRDLSKAHPRERQKMLLLRDRPSYYAVENHLSKISTFMFITNLIFQM